MSIQTPTFVVDVKDMLEAGCHFGHQAQRWNPKMAPFIYTTRNGVHIFDLFQSAQRLEAAAAHIYALAKEGKNVVFVGSKRQAQDIVKEEALAAGAMFITVRWMGGTITNWDQIKKSIDRLNTLKKDREEGKLDVYTKKERVLFDKEINKLERFLGGIAQLKQIPDAIVVVDVKKEDNAVREAKAKNVPVIGIVDSNSDPDITYPIPANDDAVRSIKLIVHALAAAFKEGRSACQK